VSPKGLRDSTLDPARESSRPPLDLHIRRGRPDDEPFIRDLAGEVFSVYGDYRPLLPKWFRVPGVETFVGEHDCLPLGYVMIAFFQDGPSLVGDVLAIAVAPGHQRQGIGRALLHHAIDVCEAATGPGGVHAIRLSVAATNAPARHLFLSCGFRELDGDFGVYDGVQKALHMERLL
jgi:ribosomal protein S18 acetylase RimI-like enzyme